MGTTIRDDAICIRHWDWSETSQTVSLFSCEHGIVRGIAKGSKREKAPFSGGLELLTRGEVVAIVRSNGSLATITSWDLRDAYTGVRRSLRAFYVGSYLVDLLHHAVTDADPHPGLYHRMVEVFETLADRTEESLLRAVGGAGRDRVHPGHAAGPGRAGRRGLLPAPRGCVSGRRRGPGPPRRLAGPTGDAGVVGKVFRRENGPGRRPGERFTGKSPAGILFAARAGRRAADDAAGVR
ncbi:MAG: DNA repair protein RecO [Planctomycetota bacterium]|nr:MAG: DNA repair protein RecO [Planctomycetota bacterium]